MALVTSPVDRAKNLLRNLLPQTRVGIISEAGGLARQSLVRDPLYPYAQDVKFFDPPNPVDVGNLAKYTFVVTFSNHVQISGSLDKVSEQPHDTPSYAVSAG